MKSIRSIFAVDSHTEGEPTRVVVGGIMNIPGSTMSEKRDYIRDNLDYLRKAIICEPRGHRDMFGCFLVEPTVREADFGVIFIDNHKYLNMCGHGTIGIATVVTETGMANISGDKKNIIFETPAGLVYIDVEMRGGKTESVSFKNVPAFVEKLDAKVNVPGLGDINMDITFGGNYFAILPIEQFGIKVTPSNCSKLKDLGMRIKSAVNDQIKVEHPTLKYINKVDIITFLDRPTKPGAKYKNVHIFSNKQADRSPGGTGTTAVLTKMYARGEIQKNEEVISEGLVGGLFKGKVLQETKIGGKEALDIQITGRAYITGYKHFVIDPNDKKAEGFTIE